MSEHLHPCPWCKNRYQEECILCGGSARVTFAFPKNAPKENSTKNLLNKLAMQMAIDTMKGKKKWKMK